MRTRSRTLTLSAVLGTAAVITSLGLAPAASAASPAPNDPTAVPSGITASALRGATVFGTTPADTPEQVSFVLKARDAGGLAVRATHSTGSFLSVSQFAQRYGQTDDVVHGLQRYLAGYGIRTSVYAGELDVSATGTAGQFDAALSTAQKQYHVPAIKARGGQKGIPAQTVHSNTGRPKLPYHIAREILAVLGLTDYSSNTTHLTKAVTKDVTASGSSDDACVALTGLTGACNLPQDYSSRYGVSPLARSGAAGQGQTIGIVTLAALDPGAPQYFWSHIAHIQQYDRSVDVVNVDGGPGAPSDASGTGETDLDVEQSGGVAPAADVRVYQAPNTDPGFVDAFFQAASDDVAQSVSTSWGESETIVAAAAAAGEEPKTVAAAYDEAYEELAVQGQSTFAASGDEGAYAASIDLGSTNLSVQLQTASPYITAAGGTTLPFSATFAGSDGSTASVTVPKERAWGWDYLWQAISTVSGAPLDTTAESLVEGSTGGYSAYQPMPWYQQGISGAHRFSAVPYLTPTDYQQVVPGFTVPTAWSFDPTPPVVHGTGSTRAVPDLSADADPETGYLLWEPSASQPLQGGWGGTSFVAPQFAGTSAVIDSALGHRVGFWNPRLYGLAGSSAVHPLDASGTSNDNIYYTGTPGTEFNPATGLGIPDFARVAAAFGRAH